MDYVDTSVLIAALAAETATGIAHAQLTENHFAGGHSFRFCKADVNALTTSSAMVSATPPSANSDSSQPRRPGKLSARSLLMTASARFLPNSNRHHPFFLCNPQNPWLTKASVFS